MSGRSRSRQSSSLSRNTDDQIIELVSLHQLLPEIRNSRRSNKFHFVPSMADENGGTGDRKFSWMPSPFSILEKLITSTLSIPLKKLSFPPLLPVANPRAPPTANPIIETLQEYELGKVVLTLAFPATTGLLYSAANGNSEKLDVAHHFILVGLMAACTALVNGLLLKKPFPRHANLLQLLGSGLGLLFAFGLVGSFLPKGFSWACWLCGVLCQTPFIYAGIAIWKA